MRQFLIERKKPDARGYRPRDIHNGKPADVPRGWRIVRELTR